MNIKLISYLRLKLIIAKLIKVKRLIILVELIEVEELVELIKIDESTELLMLKEFIELVGLEELKEKETDLLLLTELESKKRNQLKLTNNIVR